MSARAEPETIESLREELAAVRRREAELRQLLAEAHEQLAKRDDEIVHEAVLRARLAYQQMEQMRQTRVWRMGTAFWRARARAGRLLRR